MSKDYGICSTCENKPNRFRKGRECKSKNPYNHPSHFIDEEIMEKCPAYICDNKFIKKVPAAKKTAFTITAWSNSEDLIDKSLTDVLLRWNEIHFNFCAPIRRKECESKRMCIGCDPSCTNDLYKFIGKNYYERHTISYQEARRRANKKLKELFKKCKKYRIAATRI